MIEEATPMSTPTLAFKGVAVDEGIESQIVDINEPEGIVTAVVSVTGVKDDVDDVIEPGAYAETLKVRKPKVCWHHAWEKPVGRVLHAEELLPGDPRLPKKARDGSDWPPEGGALIATMQFNLKSERGREAFEAVRFYSETGECEWSIGYQVAAGKSRRDKNGVRWIKAIDLFELSFVLFGAHSMTGTLALKAAVMMMTMLTKTAAGTVAISKDEFEQTLKALRDDDDYPDDEDGEVDPADEDGETSPPADAPAAGDDPGDPIEDDGDTEQVLLFGDDQGIPDDEADEETPADSDEDEDEDEDEEPAGKALEAARLAIKSTKTSDADTDIAATCTCGDTVVFDTMNGWMRKDGSYSHEDGSTHSDHLEPPAAHAVAWNAEKALHDRVAPAFIRLTALGQIKADTTPGDKPSGAAELIEWYERGEGAAKIRWGQSGDFMRCVRIAEKHMTPEQARGFCSNRHLGALGVRPGQEGGKAFPVDSDLVDSPPPDRMANEDPKQTGVMVAVYPSPETAEQIAVRGGEAPEELHITLAFLGNTSDLVTDGMTLDDLTGRIVAAAQIAAATHTTVSGSVGGIGKFPDSGDGVPVWAPVDVVGLNALRESVVTALSDAGLPVKTDHGFTPHMTLGYNLDMALIPPVDGVPVSFDKLTVAVGASRTDVPLGQDPDIPASGAPVAGAPLNPPLDDEVKAAAYDPTIETGPDAGHRPAIAQQQKGFPYLEGTYEERQRNLEHELALALIPPRDPDDRDPDAYVSIDGTWPDRVVCTVSHYGGVGPSQRQSWEVPYVVNVDGSITLGTPEKVRLTVTAVDEDGGELADVPVGDLMPLTEMVEQVTDGIKTVIGGTEVKAGRVLSASNALRLRSAVEHLVSVLAAAGIEISDPTDQHAATNPTVDTETTAPSAREGGAKALTVDDVADDLSSFETVLQES